MLTGVKLLGLDMTLNYQQPERFGTVGLGLTSLKRYTKLNSVDGRVATGKSTVRGWLLSKNCQGLASSLKTAIRGGVK